MTDDQEPVTSPMEARDRELAAQYTAEATGLHSQATAEETVGNVMDALGLGADMHAKAAGHERESQTDGKRAELYGEAADSWRDADESGHERSDVARRAEQASVRASQADQRFDEMGTHGHVTAHEVTDTYLEKKMAHTEEDELRRQLGSLEELEHSQVDTAKELEHQAQADSPSAAANDIAPSDAAGAGP